MFCDPQKLFLEANLLFKPRIVCYIESLAMYTVTPLLFISGCVSLFLYPECTPTHRKSVILGTKTEVPTGKQAYKVIMCVSARVRY